MKEVRIKTPKIGRHDLEIKINRARGFLHRGDRVQFTLRFRGREMAHQNLGREILNSIKAALEEVAKVERDFRMEGRRLTMVLASTVDQRQAASKNKSKSPSKPAATEAEPKPAAMEVEPKPAVTEVEPKPAVTEAEPEPVVTEVEPEPAAPEVEPKPAVTEAE
jgi:translation initiation factor IF-3